MKISDSEKALEEFVSAVEKFDLHTTRIFFGYPLDLLTMDMGQISSDCIFISNSDVDRGKLLLIQDEELKEELYKFAKEHPDRVFRGRRDTNDRKRGYKGFGVLQF